MRPLVLLLLLLLAVAAAMAIASERRCHKTVLGDDPRYYQITCHNGTYTKLPLLYDPGAPLFRWDYNNTAASSQDRSP